MMGNITITNDTGPRWMNNTNGIHEQLYYDGSVSLNSMPTMTLADWLQINADATEDLASPPVPDGPGGPRGP